MNSLQTDQRHGAARAISATNAWFWAVVSLGYLLPWAIAASRGARNSAGIFWLNLLAGWTVVGWVAALIMAAQRHQQLVLPLVDPVAVPVSSGATCSHCRLPVGHAPGYGWGHPHSGTALCDDQLHTATPAIAALARR